MIYKRRPRNFAPSFEVVSCFFECDGNILLLKRQLYKSQGGKWGVPAGKIDENETKVNAIIREIHEETRLNISSNELTFFKSISVHHASDFIYHMFHYSLLKKVPITLNPHEHIDYKWVSIEDSFKLPLVEDLDECIKMFYLLKS